MLAVEIPALKSFSVPLFSHFSPQFLRSSTQITWGALFRHEVLSRDPLLLAMIPKYLRASMTNLVKVCGNCGQIGVRRCLGEHGLWIMREKLNFYCVCHRRDLQVTEQTALSQHFTVCSLPSVFISLKLVLAMMGDFSSFLTLSTLFPGGLSL